MIKTLEEVIGLIKDGSILHVSGRRETLDKLPQGLWLGGTTHHFATFNGIIPADDLLCVQEISGGVEYRCKIYDSFSIENITADCFDNGYSILLLPHDSEVAKKYMQLSLKLENLFMFNIAGWVSVPENQAESALVYSGNGGRYDNYAVVLHVKLPDDKRAEIGIIDIFEPDKSRPSISFPQECTVVSSCKVGGIERNFAEYLREENVDLQTPLIADYSGSYVNVSFGHMTDETVSFHANLYPDTEYWISKSVENYGKMFSEKISDIGNVNVVFSCNCHLNYIYGKLGSCELGQFSGPISYGEIAYLLMNQTLVYIAITQI